LRTGPWRGHGKIACLSPLPDGPLPSAAFVRQCLDQLAARGFSSVVTTALSVPEQTGFLGAGFGVEEDLHLLVHDLRGLPPAPPASLRRATHADRRGVLDVDAIAFPPFWRIDDEGLTDALAATPRTRFRVASGQRAVTGYAISGRAGRRGFLQRLAVEPHHQREGLGRALALDALYWLRRWRVERAFVNTQLDNAAALSLYESLGFRREETRLSVLSRGLGT
jgi:ribosomal protein S18 acetylase RimI-like enzyme